jgi:hypothetical protein
MGCLNTEHAPVTANFKQPRLRSEKYLRSLREMPCLSCGIAPAGVAHHLLRAEERGVGLKTGDNHAVPMCNPCHTRLHMNGDEIMFWDLVGINAYQWANKNWREFNGDT